MYIMHSPYIVESYKLVQSGVQINPANQNIRLDSIDIETDVDRSHELNLAKRKTVNMDFCQK